jgi:hypothetical protein
MSSADAAGADNFNATRRDRMSKGWPQDRGAAGADPSAAQGVNQWPGSNPTTAKQASALEYQTYETVPGQQHAVVHRGVPIGYVQKYSDPGHGPLWSAVIADHVHARNPHRAQTQRGFVHDSDAHAHVMDAHRDVAQIESSGVWRPGPPGGGPNLPGR